MNQEQVNRAEATERFADHLRSHNLTIRGDRLESTVDPAVARMKIQLEMIEAMRPIAQSLPEEERPTAADELDLRAKILAAETGTTFAKAYVKVFDSEDELRARYSKERR